MSDFSEAEQSDAGRAAAEASLDLAAQLLLAGRAAEAQAFLTLAAEQDLPAVAALAAEPGSPLRAMAARTLVLHSPRGPEIARPCAILGPARPDLDAGTEELVRGIFDHHQRRFEAGATPPLTGLYDTPAPEGSGRGRRALLVMPKHIHSNPAFVENDFSHHIAASAAGYGLDLRVFASDALVNDTPNRAAYTDAEIAEAWATLHRTVAAFRPEILLFEGNFYPTERTLDTAWLQSLRVLYGCRTVTFLGDVYDTEFDFFSHWAPASDAVVLFNAETSYPLRSGQEEKAFRACGLPMDAALFTGSHADKAVDVVVIGGNTRSRKELLILLDAHGVELEACLHHRLSRNTPTLPQYAALTRKGRMTVNTGRVEKTRALSIVTGRCFEAVLARTVLLEEAGSRLSDVLMPFVHYVPFSNADQLVGFAQFLARNDDYRRRIADQAFDWHHRHFGADRFWRALLGRFF